MEGTFKNDGGHSKSNGKSMELYRGVEMTTTATNLRCSALRENLSAALNQVSRAAARRTTLPITQNVLIETDGEALRVITTTRRL